MTELRPFLSCSSPVPGSGFSALGSERLLVLTNKEDLDSACKYVWEMTEVTAMEIKGPEKGKN